MAMADSKAPVRLVKRVQFGILSPDEIVSDCKCLCRFSTSEKEVFEVRLHLEPVGHTSPSLDALNIAAVDHNWNRLNNNYL